MLVCLLHRTYATHVTIGAATPRNSTLETRPETVVGAAVVTAPLLIIWRCLRPNLGGAVLSLWISNLFRARIRRSFAAACASNTDCPLANWTEPNACPAETECAPFTLNLPQIRYVSVALMTYSGRRILLVSGIGLLRSDWLITCILARSMRATSTPVLEIAVWTSGGRYDAPVSAHAVAASSAN